MRHNKTECSAMLAFIVSILLSFGCRSEVTEQTAPITSTTPQTEAFEPATAPAEAPTTASTAAPEPRAAPDELMDGSANLPWWNDTVFYEVFVRSFQDSDGDGVGDLVGLIDRLDYLNDGDEATTDDLGVTGIWLMPITESPSYHGYDVVDYYQVDQEYGTNEDFLRLMDEAHARGLKVIVDLVLNHTGRDHPWFQESLSANSERRGWYVWVEQNPGFRGPWGQTVWYGASSGFYYAVFWEGMPDLNYLNPEVTSAMQDVTRFWLEEMGVDGFRLDAIKHLIENGRVQENTLETHAWLESYFDFYKSINPNALTVGEAWTTSRQVLDYTGDEVDVAFAFDLAEDILRSSKIGIGRMAADSQSELVESFPPGQYATFITNHDQNRAMSQLDGDESSAKVAASILLTSPGVPFIYYGEEIGMMGVKPDEDIRLPMQWTGEAPGAGFTDGAPWRPPNEDLNQRNVKNQLEDPDSLLNHYRTLIRLRNDHKALRVGQWTLVDSEPGQLYAFLRHSEHETILVLLNPGRNPSGDYGLTLEVGPLQSVTNGHLLFGEGDVSLPILNESGGFSDYAPIELLPPLSSFVIQLSSP